MGWRRLDRADLANPAGWTPPRKILDGEQGRATVPGKKGSGWYVSAIGTGPKETDKRIGERARLFVTGHSRAELRHRSARYRNAIHQNRADGGPAKHRFP